MVDNGILLPRFNIRPNVKIENNIEVFICKLVKTRSRV